MSLTHLLPEVTSLTTPDVSSAGKFAQLRKNRHEAGSAANLAASPLASALANLAARAVEERASTGSELRGVRFHLTRDNASAGENVPLQSAHQRLLVRLYWRGSESTSSTELRGWALENSRIRGRLEAFNQNEIRMNVQVEVPCGSLLEVRVINACENETDLRAKAVECHPLNDGEWSVRCKLVSPLTTDQILRLCGN